MKKETKTINDLSKLSSVLSKEEYQNLWTEKRTNWREQVARKNKRWLKDNEKYELTQLM